MYRSSSQGAGVGARRSSSEMQGEKKSHARSRRREQLFSSSQRNSRGRPKILGKRDKARKEENEGQGEEEKRRAAVRLHAPRSTALARWPRKKELERAGALGQCMSQDSWEAAGVKDHPEEKSLVRSGQPVLVLSFGHLPSSTSLALLYVPCCPCTAAVRADPAPAALVTKTPAQMHKRTQCDRSDGCTSRETQGRVICGLSIHLFPSGFVSCQCRFPLCAFNSLPWPANEARKRTPEQRAKRSFAARHLV